MIRNPDLPLHGHFSAAGSRWSIRSNSAALLQCAAATFPRLTPRGRARLHADIYVDNSSRHEPLWHVPQFRGREHLVFADYGPGDRILADLGSRHVIGCLSAATAADISFGKRVIFPILLGIVGAVVGVTALHCACLRYKGEGLLFAGESGAGKSTLSFELSRRGLDFISDDWTYFSPAGGEVLAWGLPTNIKLLPDSISHFSELARYVPQTHLNGELALDVAPEEVGIRRARCCRPGRIFVLERQPGSTFEPTRLAAGEISAYFRHSLEKLPACLADSRETQLATIRALCQAECWHIRCGGTPREIATRILQFCDHTSPRSATPAAPFPVTRREWPDLLRRFSPLPIQESFASDGFTVQVASNSERAISALRRITQPRTHSLPPVISWSIQEEPEWPADMLSSGALACGALSFLNLGGHSFAAFDRQTMRAVTFIAGRNAGRELESSLRLVFSHLLRESAALPHAVPHYTSSSDSSLPAC